MTDAAMSPLRRRMIEDMTVRKLSPKTQQGYIGTIKNFAAFLGRSPDKASFEDVRQRTSSTGRDDHVPAKSSQIAPVRWIDRNQAQRALFDLLNILFQELLMSVVELFRCRGMRRHVNRLERVVVGSGARNNLNIEDNVALTKSSQASASTPMSCIEKVWPLTSRKTQSLLSLLPIECRPRTHHEGSGL
jgi:Phage integrase, N-terminal SAM-like domain